MYAKGWRDRLTEELERTGTTKSRASAAAKRNSAWVSEFYTKGKEPTIEPFARMCIETGMRMGYILTGEGSSPEAERFAALFSTLDASTYPAVLALLEKMPKASPES